MANIKVGQKFGKWEVLDQPPVYKRKQGDFYCCRCECGREQYILCYRLLNGRSTQCAKCARGALKKMYSETERNYDVRKRCGRWEERNEFTLDSHGRLHVFCDDDYK